MLLLLGHRGAKIKTLSNRRSCKEMQDCHWQEALSMINCVTEDLCISVQSSRQGEFPSLAEHLFKLDTGCKLKQIQLAISFLSLLGIA